MIYDNVLKGKFVNLRSVLTSDSEFILKLRLDENLNKYINKVDNDLEKQILWIKNQQKAENDYYFLIESIEGNPLGTISLYNIQNSEGEFGRWVSIGNSVQNLESVIILHDFGFYELGLDLIYSETVRENKKVLNFHKRFGATILNDFTEYNNFILQKAIIKKDEYKNIRKKNIELINYFS